MVARLCVVIILFSVSLSGETARDWASLGHTPAISQGTEIQAKTTDNKRYQGQFKAADDEALVMIIAGGEQRVPRATVARVSVKREGRRLRHTLIGLAIGAAGGIALGAIADARCTGNCIEGKTPLGKEVGTGLGAVIGAIIGVALPTGGWHEVYRAP